MGHAGPLFGARGGPACLRGSPYFDPCAGIMDGDAEPVCSECTGGSIGEYWHVGEPTGAVILVRRRHHTDGRRRRVLVYEPGLMWG